MEAIQQISLHRTSQNSEAVHTFTGRVSDFLYVGDVTTYVIELINGVRLEALLANATPGVARFFEVGDTVTVSWPMTAVQFLRNG